MDLGATSYLPGLKPQGPEEAGPDIPARIAVGRIYHISGYTGRNSTAGFPYRFAVHHQRQAGVRKRGRKGKGKRVEAD
jgi:hypothetical protein